MKHIASLILAATISVSLAQNGNEPKGLLVLQCGSDWCLSGECVRKTFESEEFRGKLRDRFDFAVYDDMDAPAPEVAAKNKELEKWRVESRRFPAITCLSAGNRRFFAMPENIPFDIKASELAHEIEKADKRRIEAEKYFRKAMAASDEASKAEAYGRGFALLTEQAGYFTAWAVRKGNLAYAAEWKKLAELDKDGRYGWKFRFETGDGVDIVRKGTDYRLAKNFKEGDDYIASLRKMPQSVLLPVQRQSIDMAEYALYRKTPGREEANKALLRKVLATGRETVWGQSALGYLILSGEKIPLKPRLRAALRQRPAQAAKPVPPFPLEETVSRIADIAPDTELTEAQKKDIVFAAVLRSIGEAGWKALHGRPGADAFAKAFFGDRIWMEDFIWSGPCDGAKALLALESIIYQDGGKWTGPGDRPGRRFATAAALQCSVRDEAWFADLNDAYRETARELRLHKETLVQPVWRWRYALQQTQPMAFSHMLGEILGPDIPDQQRYISHYVNMPRRKYNGACHMIPYRGHNCFGDSVQTAIYYESWLKSWEYPLRKWTPVIGGVCGELSRFGAACANAHGLPATTCGQPYHCAYLLRQPDGKWFIGNNVAGPTGNHSTFLGGGYSFLPAHEGTFEPDRERRSSGPEREKLEDANRWTELAAIAKSRGAGTEREAALLKRALSSWPTHYIARRSAAANAAKRPLPEHRAFALDCAKSLAGWHEPLWELLSPYFGRTAEEKGAAALCDELVAFAPLLKQSQDRSMEGDFKSSLETWSKPFANEPALKEKAICAMLKAQYGSGSFFAKTLDWCGGFMTADKDRLERLAALLGRLCGADGALKGPSVNLAPLLLTAENSGNIDAFKRLNALQNSIAPEKFGTSKRARPANDFGARLLSADGMLRISSTSRWDAPTRHIHAIDATPVEGNLFHTGSERNPWAEVVLAGPSAVKGVMIENGHPNKGVRGRAVPLEVQISEDGKEWKTVFEDATVRDVYRVDLTANAERSRRVRVRRKPGVKEEPLHFTKILVYGDKLY